MIKRFAFVVSALFGVLMVAGCVGKPITDFEGRSVVYGWISLKEASGNSLFAGSFRAYNLPEGKNLYPIGYAKLDDGYVIYHVGITPGPVKLNKISVETCIGLCTNVINIYDFGAQGSGAFSAMVDKKGVYYLGSYGLHTIGGNFFGPSKFSVEPATGPSRKEMLELILKTTPAAQKPLIQAEINRL